MSNLALTYPAILLLSVYAKDYESKCPYKNLHMSVDGNTIPNI